MLRLPIMVISLVVGHAFTVASFGGPMNFILC
jgi:hypothetical protein